MNFRPVILFIIILISFSLKGQDTLKINIEKADSLFLNNNFYLLASSMNIEAQKAQIIQAKAYPNPVFTAELHAYDTDNNKVLNIGKTGDKEFQLEQLILLGGKRKSEIEIAKTNVKIAELEFQKLLLQLKFQLHSNLFSIGQIQGLLQRYNDQLNLLETLVLSYETQADKGNIPLKDVVRLKGAYLKLNNDRAALLKEYFEIQTTLQILLKTSSIVDFQFSESDIEKYVQLKTLDQIKSEAFINRPELQIIQQNKTLAEQYLQYQKSMAVPDINLFTRYSQTGGAFKNQINAGIAIPLPFWNRNQGNIKTSQFMIKEVEYNLQAMQNEMESELNNAFMLYTQTVFEYQKASSLYNIDFETTVNGMIDNFRKRNVSIVEFIDFFEAYNDVLNELTRIKTQLVISAQQINLLTGKDIY